MDSYALRHPIQNRRDRRYQDVEEAIWQALKASPLATERLYCGEATVLADEVMTGLERSGFVK